jgi:hypothetical protein
MTDERRRLDGNLYLLGHEVRCSRCDAVVGTADSWLANALIREAPAESGSTPAKAAPELFVDAPIVYRQAFCPGCTTALLTEVVAETDRRLRRKCLTADSV